MGLAEGLEVEGLEVEGLGGGWEIIEEMEGGLVLSGSIVDSVSVGGLVFCTRANWDRNSVASGRLSRQAGW